MADTPSVKGYLVSSSVYVVGENNAKHVANETIAAGNKRPYGAIAVNELPANNRDAGSGQAVEIRPAKNFAKFVDYNFSAMTDTKGGFLTTDDDPFNKALQDVKGSQEVRPVHMSVAEWERMQTIRNLKRLKQGPFEPGLSVLADAKEQKCCAECGSREIDWVWEEVFAVSVCNACKDKLPERYSLLTKTECKEDYLLTDRKLSIANTGAVFPNQNFLCSYSTFLLSRASRCRASSASFETQPSQVPLARHDALLALPGRRIRNKNKMGIHRSPGC